MLVQHLFKAHVAHIPQRNEEGGTWNQVSNVLGDLLSPRDLRSKVRFVV